LFKDIQDLLKYITINSHAEQRDLEYKKGTMWNSLKLKITRAALALANLEGGGYIIIGVERDSKSVPFEPRGMPNAVSNTFVQDTVSSFVNEYAEPHIGIDLKHFNDNEKFFVVIQVHEFKEIPIICRKSSDETVRGRIYYRTTRQMESSSDLTAEELREIIELSVDKGIVKQKRRIKKYGFEGDQNPFEMERGSF